MAGMMYRLPFLALTLSLALTGLVRGETAERRHCFSQVETRESVAAHRLREPLALLREAARETRAEPLGTRLCLWNEKFVYEMSLLRRDGRVVRVFTDAASGARLSAREIRER